MTEIIVYGCLCNLENLPRSGDLSFMKISAVLNYNAWWESGCRNPFLLFFQKRKQIGASLGHEGPMMEQSGPTLSIPPPQAQQKASPTLLPGLPLPQGSPGTCFKTVKFSSMVVLHLVSDFLNSAGCFVLCSPVFGIPMGIFSIVGDHQNCFQWELIFNLPGS